MPPTADVPLTLLDRYLAGECSPDEIASVQQWIALEPAHNSVLAQVRTIQHVVAHEPVWNAGTMWYRVSRHVLATPIGAAGSHDQHEQYKEQHTQQHTQSRTAVHRPHDQLHQTDSALCSDQAVHAAQPARSRYAKWSGLNRIALSATGIAAIAIGAYFGAKTLHGTDSQLVKQVAYHTVSTLQGQRAQFQLPDGSTVLLGPDTRLQYRSVAEESERVIELYGEALFTVTHAERAPFIVRANGTTVRVLGTTFAVRKYNDESSARVVVAEGRVSVASHSTPKPVVLSTGEGVQVDGSGALTIDRAVNLKAVLAWTQGRLDFTRTPLRIVVADVARMYDIDLQIASPTLANQLVTGAIDDRISPSDALAMLAGMVGGRIERNGSGFIFIER